MGCRPILLLSGPGLMIGSQVKNSRSPGASAAILKVFEESKSQSVQGLTMTWCSHLRTCAKNITSYCFKTNLRKSSQVMTHPIYRDRDSLSATNYIYSSSAY